MTGTTARTDPAPPPARRDDRKRAALLATLVAVPVVLIMLLVPFLVTRGDAGTEPEPSAAPSPVALPPVEVAPPPALGAAAQRSCQELVSALPTVLGDLPARPVDSSSPYVTAWGEPAVTLRCGVSRPPAFLATAEVQDINGVIWFAERRGAVTAWTAVDRPVYVEVVAPSDAASSAVARLSTPLSRALPKRDLDPVPD